MGRTVSSRLRLPAIVAASAVLLSVLIGVQPAAGRLRPRRPDDAVDPGDRHRRRAARRRRSTASSGRRSSRQHGLRRRQVHHGAPGRLGVRRQHGAPQRPAGVQPHHRQRSRPTFAPVHRTARSRPSPPRPTASASTSAARSPRSTASTSTASRPSTRPRAPSSPAANPGTNVDGQRHRRRRLDRLLRRRLHERRQGRRATKARRGRRPRTAPTSPWAPRSPSGDVLGPRRLARRHQGRRRRGVHHARTVRATRATASPWSTRPRRATCRSRPTTSIRNGGSQAAIYSLAADANGVYGSGYNFGGGGSLEGSFRADLGTAQPHLGRGLPRRHLLGRRRRRRRLRRRPPALLRQHRRLPADRPAGPSTAAIAFSEARPRTTVTTDPYGYYNFAGTPAPSSSTGSPSSTPAPTPARARAPGASRPTTSTSSTAASSPTVNGKAAAGPRPLRRAERSPRTRWARGTPAPTSRPNVVSLVVRHASASAWQANWDPDNATLTYGCTATATSRRRSTRRRTASTFWNDPAMGFIDTGLDARAARTSYRVRATDPSATPSSATA